MYTLVDDQEIYECKPNQPNLTVFICKTGSICSDLRVIWSVRRSLNRVNVMYENITWPSWRDGRKEWWNLHLGEVNFLTPWDSSWESDRKTRSVIVWQKYKHHLFSILIHLNIVFPVIAKSWIYYYYYVLLLLLVLPTCCIPCPLIFIFMSNLQEPSVFHSTFSNKISWLSVK